MNTKKIAVFLAFLLVFNAFSPITLASEDDDNGRYFIATTKGFWKSTFSARHAFEDGFTTDLSDWQLRFAKIAGLEVYPVRKLTILPSFPGEGLLGKFRAQARPTPSSSIPWGIEMMYASESLEYTDGGAGVNVAVLDSGVMREHPDLKNRITGCKDFTSSKQPVVDDKCEDKNGHGTHVAGIILADAGSDQKGIYGMAPEANLMAYKVCGTNGSCWSDDIAAAIRQAAANGANIINMSLGSDSASSLIEDAVAEAAAAGVLVVAAAGNDGPYPASIDYPAALVEVVAVGALDSNKAISSWSSRGINSATQPYVLNEKDIEFAAPGAGIESTWKDGGYAVLSGTSMAAPHVAGLAAKLWASGSLTPAASTRNIIRQLADDLSPQGDDDASGWGLPTL